MREDVPLAELQLTGRVWETYHAVVYAVCVVIVEDNALTTPARVAASVALAGMIPWYLFFGRRLIGLEGEAWNKMAAGWRGPAYLTGLIALFAVVQHADTNAWFLAFGVIPQCFGVTTYRRAMAFIVVFNALAALLNALANPEVQGVVGSIGLGVFTIVFAQVFGAWTMRIIERNRQHAALNAQLRSTRAELAAAHHQQGVFAERSRLAAEIHDTLAQGFTSIVTLVQAAQTSVPEANPAREHLNLALRTARENLAEARALVAALSPVGLEGASLGDAVTRAARATEEETRSAVRCEISGPERPLPTPTEVVLLRVCQEALANVRQHAAANSVDVSLRYSGDQVDLTVADDGLGFDAGEEPAPGEYTVSGNVGNGGGGAGRDGAGYGLRGMRDRLRQAGGTLTVTSAPGVGTTIRAQVRA
jgi:signal transduction histidine kinase